MSVIFLVDSLIQNLWKHVMNKLGKLETSYFSFDQYDWSLSVYPTGKADSQLGKRHNRLGSVALMDLKSFSCLVLAA